MQEIPHRLFIACLLFMHIVEIGASEISTNFFTPLASFWNSPMTSQKRRIYIGWFQVWLWVIVGSADQDLRDLGGQNNFWHPGLSEGKKQGWKRQESKGRNGAGGDRQWGKDEGFGGAVADFVQCGNCLGQWTPHCLHLHVLQRRSRMTLQSAVSLEENRSQVLAHLLVTTTLDKSFKASCFSFFTREIHSY